MDTAKHVLSLLLLAGILSNAFGIILYDDVPQCPELYGEQAYPHPEDCGSFFLCTNGTLTLEHCENGLLFDGKGSAYNHCNYHWAVHCGERKADLTPISSPGCEYQFGLYPDSDSCSTSYIKCIYGEPHQEPCHPGLVYDDRIHGCNWPDLMLHLCDPEAVVGFKCPHEHQLKGQTAAKFWPLPRFGVPNDCGRYIVCVDGHPRLNTCGDKQLFDSVELGCKDSDDHPLCA